MLFQEQRDFFEIIEGEPIYYNGVFIVDVQHKIIGLVTAIKQQDGKIRTIVTYHKENEQPEIKMKKVLDPISFEKFLSQLTLKVQENGKQLIEFNYRTRVLDDSFSVHLDDNEKERLHQIFLLKIIRGTKRSDAYNHITSLIRKIVSQKI